MKKLDQNEIRKNGVYIQGDIIFSAAPKNCEASPKAIITGIIAEGEATGHAHRVNPKTVKISESTIPAVLWIRGLTGDEVEVKHEEHHSLKLPSETISWQQQEYDAVQGLRKVAD